jgi:hypothetical protein
MSSIQGKDLIGLILSFLIENPIIASIGPAVFIILNWISITADAFKGMKNEES